MIVLKIFCGLGAVLGWVSMLLSVATYMLFWRVDNEPGVTGSPEMLYAAIAMGCFGPILFFAGNGLLIYWREKNILLITWLFIFLAAMLACLLSPLLLILMV
jgi:hypothetical protein